MAISRSGVGKLYTLLVPVEAIPVSKWWVGIAIIPAVIMSILIISGAFLRRRDTGKPEVIILELPSQE
jgi:hypothetical protein